MDALTDYALHPEKYPNDVIHSDENVVIISDKYPKAKKTLSYTTCKSNKWLCRLKKI